MFSKLIAPIFTAVLVAGSAIEKRQDAVDDLTSDLGGVASDLTSWGGSVGGEITGGFGQFTSGAGDVFETVVSVGGSAYTVVTQEGGDAWTKVESGAGVATSIGGSYYNVATEAVASGASEAAGDNDDEGDGVAGLDVNARLVAMSVAAVFGGVMLGAGVAL